MQAPPTPARRDETSRVSNQGGARNHWSPQGKGHFYAVSSSQSITLTSLGWRAPIGSTILQFHCKI